MPVAGLVDMHCHILPSVDDGAKNMEEAIRMLKMEYDQGVRTMIVTPHYRKRMFETSVSEIKKQFRLLREVAWEYDRELRLYLGCEFHAEVDMVSLLKAGEVLPMAGSRYVLTEFSNSMDAFYIRERLYALLSNGYKPVIAHIERYGCMRENIGLIDELIGMGAFVQVNADSITGKEGFGTRYFCKKLLKNGKVHFVGSDCHGSQERISRLGEAYDYVSKKYDSDYADEIFIRNPKGILLDAKKRRQALKKRNRM
nr:CpsB/CapC family capsule biosynthesis tyrosine phosphatase [uncultured Blautia sp.]